MHQGIIFVFQCVALLGEVLHCPWLEQEKRAPGRAQKSQRLKPVLNCRNPWVHPMYICKQRSVLPLDHQSFSAAHQKVDVAYSFSGALTAWSFSNPSPVKSKVGIEKSMQTKDEGEHDHTAAHQQDKRLAGDDMSLSAPVCVAGSAPGVSANKASMLPGLLGPSIGSSLSWLGPWYQMGEHIRNTINIDQFSYRPMDELVESSVWLNLEKNQHRNVALTSPHQSLRRRQFRWFWHQPKIRPLRRIGSSWNREVHWHPKGL